MCEYLHNLWYDECPVPYSFYTPLRFSVDIKGGFESCVECEIGDGTLALAQGLSSYATLNGA